MDKGIIKTEEDSIVFKSIHSEKLDYEISEYTLENGMKVPVIVSDMNFNSIEEADSYFSLDNVVYSIHVASKNGSEENARETLINILKLCR